MNEKRQTEITGSFAVNRGYRLLYLYQKLMQGGNLQKKELAERFGVSEKTVQRDIDDLRAYMADSMIDTARPMEIRYSKSENAYVLDMSEEENILETEVVRIGRALLAGEALETEEAEKLLRLLMLQIPVSRRQKLTAKIRR
ncbi:MAG: HTH domain-containing protein [Clostridia bacterium]|nr:HTH domain-containing protein [Clostridia bacterium]